MLVCTVEEFRAGLNETSEEAAMPQRRIEEKENANFMVAFGADSTTGSYLQVWHQPHEMEDGAFIRIDNLGVAIEDDRPITTEDIIMAKDSKTGNTVITEAQAKARIHWVNTRGGRCGRQERALVRLLADPQPCTQTTFDIKRLQIKRGYAEAEG